MIDLNMFSVKISDWSLTEKQSTDLSVIKT
jgi:hypothetical protein